MKISDGTFSLCDIYLSKETETATACRDVVSFNSRCGQKE